MGLLPEIILHKIPRCDVEKYQQILSLQRTVFHTGGVSCDAK